MLSGRSRRATLWRSIASIVLVAVLLPWGTNLLVAGRAPAERPMGDGPVRSPAAGLLGRGLEPSGGIPGSDPNVERFVPAPMLALKILERESAQAAARVPPRTGLPSPTFIAPRRRASFSLPARTGR